MGGMICAALARSVLDDLSGPRSEPLSQGIDEHRSGRVHGGSVSQATGAAGCDWRRVPRTHGARPQAPVTLSAVYITLITRERANLLSSFSLQSLMSVVSCPRLDQAKRAPVP